MKKMLLSRIKNIRFTRDRSLFSSRRGFYSTKPAIFKPEELDKNKLNVDLDKNKLNVDLDKNKLNVDLNKNKLIIELDNVSADKNYHGYSDWVRYDKLNERLYSYSDDAMWFRGILGGFIGILIGCGIMYTDYKTRQKHFYKYKIYSVSSGIICTGLIAVSLGASFVLCGPILFLSLLPIGIPIVMWSKHVSTPVTDRVSNLDRWNR